MNFSAFNKVLSRRNTICVTKQLLRSTCKIAIELEENVQLKFDSKELKHRQHPGIVKSNHIELPINIQYALKRVIGDQPIKSLLRDCKLLNQYIYSRHPPIEEAEFKTKVRGIVHQIDKTMPPIQLEIMSEEERANWRRQREHKIKKIIGERSYSWKPITYGPYESLVYAIGRAAQEYSILNRILSELQQRDKHFQPHSYLDFGSGVGTGMWAVNTFWKDSIYEFFNVDSSREMNELSELILRDGNENQQVSLKNVFYRQFLPSLDTKYDLIISSYSLFELPNEKSRKEVLLNLWRKCDGYLILVEEGTRRASELIDEARNYLLSFKDNDELNGHVFAPCAHDSICPRHSNVNDRTPCNFEASYKPLHLGDINADHLTARYCYIVIRKGDTKDPTQQWPRLVRPTLSRSGHAVCRVCSGNAKLQEIILTAAKHGKTALRCAKSSNWGDRLPFKIGDEYDTETTTTKIKGKYLDQNNFRNEINKFN